MRDDLFSNWRENRNWKSWVFRSMGSFPVKKSQQNQLKQSSEIRGLPPHSFVGSAKPSGRHMIALIVARKRQCDLDGYMEKKHVQMARIRYFSLVSVKRDYTNRHMAMDQYLLIPFLGEWTSIYQLFWCSPGVDTSPHMYFLSGSSRLAQDLIGACWKRVSTVDIGERALFVLVACVLTKHSKHQRWMLDGVGCGRDAGWSLIECFWSSGPTKSCEKIEMFVAWLCTTPKHSLSPTTARRTTSLNLDLFFCGRFLATPYIGPLLIVRPWAEVISCWFKGTGDWWGLCCDHFLSLNPHFLWLDHHFYG